MKYNTLGTNGFEVSEIALGCMSLPEDPKQAGAIIDEAMDNGVTYFDTADFYDKGKNEEIVGGALGKRRKDIILASKVGNEWSEESDEVKWNPTKAYIKEQIHNSLRRLQTDYLDLYQLHGGMITDNSEETIQAFEELKKEGLIRSYGISSIRPNVIRRYLNNSEIASIMMQYSLLDRRPEEFLTEIGQSGRSVVARGSLAKGLLTAEGLTRAEKMGDYLQYGTGQLKATLKKLSATHDNIHALALHSVLSDSTVAAAVTGASSPKQLRETLQAYQQPVSRQQIEEAKKATRLDRYEQHRD
ncbi:aldo/keto reductase [Planococcus sp. CP5-4]|uniref:aldo/keto reductase n=1 Tax=unclassified Planococcus (in: firmicutes) TaxID=2662419 RepID=UPI001C2104DC|nr:MULTISPECIES: aldo/keto reductase [unclassified Planococcus (in: firmicutes)]MBU9672008.1 aldo/keto reductase [Planococcus sp. CP5-4_YE]MBV0907571.1 aldo/keto reductase [Planococcus sp. CP5-4_UN]MBW6062738.1 aldo/keto reductase [Planococcus sp. CP5-4]